MTINEDFSDKAEQEMKMYDAKMMEQAKLRALEKGTLDERMAYALKKSDNDIDATLIYLEENNLVHADEHVDADVLKNYLRKSL